MGRNLIRLISLLLLIYFSIGIAHAVPTTSDLMGNGMPPALAAQLGSGAFNRTDQTVNATPWSLKADTSDGADNYSINICGGGSNTPSRGATCVFQGNEASGGGDLVCDTGDASGSDFIFRAGHSGSTFGWRDSTNTSVSTLNQTGDFISVKSGGSISIQEATAASACMGTATPNGTTNVTVTTSCAVTGARVFFSRVGSVTNMASISVTSAPNGTNFQFASTGASDTLASSVVYLIVKESA